MSDHPVGRAAGWFLLALAGLAVAVVLSVTASNLSTQPIGLSGEPLRAGDKLAPTDVTRTQTTTTSGKRHPSTTTSTSTTTQTAPTTTSNSGTGDGDDHGGRRDHDSDDD
jgi:allophanate hydrolase subunit 2